MNRSVSSISDEIKKNSVNGVYDPLKANHKAYVRRRSSKYQGKKINEDNELKEYIVQGLKKHWSPDVISGRMRKENQLFYSSKTAIYEYLYSIRGQSLCPCLYSKRYRRRKRNKTKMKKTLIPNRQGIERRPLIVMQNKEYGHYEGDTVVSGQKTFSKTSLSVIYERKARYIDARKIKSLKPHLNNQAIFLMQERLREMKTFTLDNGIENVKHEELDLSVFFCDPYSSYQKGGVENANKLLRRYFPKGEDLNRYSDKYIRRIVKRINTTPRKSLNYKTPEEVMTENNQFKEKDQCVKLELDVKDVKKEAECSA